MSQTFKSLIGNYKGNLKIAEQTFSDEIISAKILQSSTFIKLIFLNYSFHKVNFDGSSFAKCEFNGCTFTEVLLRRVQFESCNFHNCKITDSNLDKVDFDDTSLNYCQFKKISLLASYFTDCRINESHFEEINSYGACAIIVDSQISKFNQSINLKGDFSFDDLLKFLKSIPAS